MVVPHLVHLNGAPAIGKSAVAAALVRYRALALNLDIDEIRVRLGGWQEHDQSKQIARDLGFLMAGQHLGGGFDVVLPQLLVRPEIVKRVERIALDAGAEFCQVLLVAPVEVCLERLASERRVGEHPRRAFADIAERIAFSCQAMLRLADEFPAAHVVEVAGPVEDAVRAVEAVVARATWKQDDSAWV